ncbi:hypothetical protein [Leifsonia sp. 2MCAF36]|uniref:hypothetical protein n=1 Tax=Leifsonia sp. 2MCAF36 TaxID=3232988 RepID=UPI003F9C7E66
MVRILIRMRAAGLSNMRQSPFGIVALVGTATVGLLTAAGTFLTGFTAPLHGGLGEISLLVLVWTCGRIGFAAFSGPDSVTPLDLFRILPTPQKALARSLLVVGFTDPALAFMALAFAALIVFGFRAGPAQGAISILGVAITLALVSALSTIVAAAVPSGSRRRQDASTLIAALLVSAVFVTGTLAPALMASVTDGRASVLSAVLMAMPTGWAGDSISLWSSGAPILALLLLVAFASVCVAMMRWWPRVLAERLVSAGGAGRRARVRRLRRMLPSTPTGAVASKELWLWLRDPLRSGFLLIAFVVGLGVCVVPLVSQGTDVLLPFAGLGTAIIAAAVAGNSFGFDGPSLGITVTTPHAERADIRGRQLAWLLLIGPYAVILSVAGLLIDRQPGLWPWVLALLPVALGGGCGVLALVSAVAPQPLDDGGGPTPSWTLTTYATLLLTAVTAVPVLAALVVGSATGAIWLTWLALPLGIVIGCACTIGLGRAAGTHLERHAPEMLLKLATATSGRR